MIDLSKFQATGRETCFHGRHIGAQIYDGLDGSDWRLKEYVARGGFQALREILGQDGGAGITPDQVVADGQGSGLRGRGGAGFPTGLKWSFMPRTSTARSTWSAIPTKASPAPARTATSSAYNPHIVIDRGKAIAAYAMGVATAYNYIHGEIFEVYRSGFEEALDAGRAAATR